MTNFSREALLEFLDYLANKGLMNKTTVAARKAAANRMLRILDDAEAKDVSKLNLDEVTSRFHNLEGAKYTPGSLSTYKSRLQSAIEDFMRYQQDPLNFKPNVQTARRRSNGQQMSVSRRPTTSTRDGRENDYVQPPPASVHILPIPIRPDLTIKVQGLPYDLTESEANKIANVIKAMATAD